MTTTAIATGYMLVVHGEHDGYGAPGVIISRSDTPQGLDYLVAQYQDAAVKGNVAVFDSQRGWRLGRWIVTVREAGHEHVADAVPGFFAFLLPGKGLADENAAYRRWGHHQGYEGNGGGHIYLGFRYIGQGWYKTFRIDPKRLPAMARVLHLGDRYRVVDIVGGTGR